MKWHLGHAVYRLHLAGLEEEVMTKKSEKHAEVAEVAEWRDKEFETMEYNWNLAGFENVHMLSGHHTM